MLSAQQNTAVMGQALISAYQPKQRNTNKLKAVREAVAAWEKTIPGRAQDYISQLVATEWIARGGRGLLLAGSTHNTKQNFFRMIKTPGPKNDKSLAMLAPVIADVMPIEIARVFGIKHGMTDAELVASAMKECSEAHQAKLLNLPTQRLQEEVQEAMESLARMLPVDAIGPVLGSIAAMMQGML